MCRRLEEGDEQRERLRNLVAGAQEEAQAARAELCRQKGEAAGEVDACLRSCAQVRRQLHVQ